VSLSKEICESWGLPESWLIALAQKAPFAYKSYKIPKKNGGFRQIHQPSREVKSVQYWLIENLFRKLPIHSAAAAYVTGLGIRDNAEMHCKSNFIAKFDFKNFFPSITEQNLDTHLSENLPNLSRRDIQLIKRICCRKINKNAIGHLSIGAPSSPILSNSILYMFDVVLSQEAKSLNLTYTRYADDITISSLNFLDNKIISPMIIYAIKAVDDRVKLELNHQKTIFIGKSASRRVTGLVLTNDGKVSLGRDKKRQISAMLHKYTIGTLDLEKTQYLQGLLAYANSIEPDFIARLEDKYSLPSALRLIHT